MCGHVLTVSVDRDTLWPNVDVCAWNGAKITNYALKFRWDLHASEFNLCWMNALRLLFQSGYSNRDKTVDKYQTAENCKNLL